MIQPSRARKLFASLAAAILTSAVACAVIVLAGYFVVIAANAPGTFLEIAHDYFFSGVVLVVVVAAGGFLGGLTTRRRALGTGIVAAIVAPYFGVIILDSIHGSEFTLSSDNAFQSLILGNLALVVAIVVATVTVGMRAYRWAFGLRIVTPPEIHRLALVRAPAKTLAKGQLTHIKRKPVRFAKAETQWAAYVAALEAEGFGTREISADDTYPDCTFIEDTVVMLGQVAVITSPGADSRRGEEDAVVELVAELGLETRHIRLPGTLDGGDVLKVGDTFYVGRGGRTNSEGIRQFRTIAIELGYTVVAVPVTKALHLKSAVTALPDGTVIGHPTLVDNPSIFPRYLEVPEVEGVAVVVLTNNSVLMSASAPKTAAMIQELGYRVTTVDISEFEKLEGCVTCLSVRIR
ncbi:MAG TPA: dimethylarginine dimethylaminohydrolase [Galbitalea sp.]|nr:dimethylarginine dimethylaminohydrolase [Galbitalea sp.]